MAPDIHTFNARDFRSDPIYRHRATFAGIQDELQKIAHFYRRFERQYNYFTVALVFCIAVPVALLFALPILRELGWLLIFGFLLAGIYAGTMRNRARQWQLPRDRDRLFGDVLKLLKRDMDPQEPLDIQLCLGKATQTGKAIRQYPDPHDPSRQLEDWRNPWFGIKGSFLDGSLFSLRLVERLTLSATTAPKPSSAGKQAQPLPPEPLPNSQSIANEQGAVCNGFDLNLQLHVDPRHYGDLTPLSPHLSGAVKRLPGAELIHHYSVDQDLSLTLSLPSAFTASLMYQSVALLFLSAYHALHLAAQLHQHHEPNSAVSELAFSPRQDHRSSDGSGHDTSNRNEPGQVSPAPIQQSPGGLSS